MTSMKIPLTKPKLHEYKSLKILVWFVNNSECTSLSFQCSVVICYYIEKFQKRIVSGRRALCQDKGWRRKRWRAIHSSKDPARDLQMNQSCKLRFPKLLGPLLHYLIQRSYLQLDVQIIFLNFRQPTTRQLILDL